MEYNNSQNFVLRRHGNYIVLTDGQSRQIILQDYGDEVGLWVKLLKEEVRVPKIELIRLLFQES